MRRSVTIAGLAAAACVVAGCSAPAGTGGSTAGSGGSGSSGQPRAGGDITVALTEAPDALDPTTAQTFVGRIVFANMCEGLYDVNKSLKVVPRLAASLPKITDGGTVYTIKLRQGVKFNDGTPFNAQAVKATLERDQKDPKSARSPSLKVITSITAVNPSTVRLKLATPYAPMLAILAGRSGMMESPTQIKKLGNNFGSHPVCVGPFSFASRPSQNQINLVKSKYYYDKSAVKLDKVTFEVVTQPSVEASDIRAGSINAGERIAPPQVQQLKSASNVKLRTVTSLGYQGLDINVSNSNGALHPPYKLVNTPLAQHPQLREALSLSLNRDEINKAAFEGLYRPGCTPISPVSPYAPDITCPKQDLAKAKKLVKESGVKTPIKVNLMIQAANSSTAKLAQVIQSMAGQAGFDITLTPTEFTTALSQAQAGKYDMFQVGWSGRIDPDQNITPFYAKDSALNYTGAVSPQFTKLMSQARQTTDVAKRKADYTRLTKMMMQNNNIIYLYYPTYTLAEGSNVHGIQYFGDGLVRLKSAWIG